MNIKYYESLEKHLPIGYAIVQAVKKNDVIHDFKLIKTNHAFTMFFESKMRNQLEGNDVHTIIQTHQLDHLNIHDNLLLTLKQGNRLINDVFLKTTKKYIDVKLDKLDDDTIIAYFIDVTEKIKLKETQKQYETQHQILRTALDATTDMVAVKDLDGKYIIVNQAVKEHFKDVTDQVEGKTAFDLYPSWEVPKVNGLDKEAIEKKESFRRKVTVPFSETGFVMSDITRAPIIDNEGNVKGIIAIGRDVSEEEKARKELETKHKQLQELADRYQKLSYKDDLTTLYNRRKFYKDIKALKSNSNHKLFMCDLNNFKRVNDTKGHHYGDTVLYKFSTYLSRMLKPHNGILYRIGGDEFAIILPREAVFNFKDKLKNINDMLTDFHDDLSLAYGEIDLSIDDQLNTKALDTILREADKNLYHYKKGNPATKKQTD